MSPNKGKLQAIYREIISPKQLLASIGKKRRWCAVWCECLLMCSMLSNYCIQLIVSLGGSTVSHTKTTFNHRILSRKSMRLQHTESGNYSSMKRQPTNDVHVYVHIRLFVLTIKNWRAETTQCSNQLSVKRGCYRSESTISVLCVVKHPLTST